MAQLYVTTERFEAETLIEDTNLGQEPKHSYRDIEYGEGKDLERKIGFNPMCIVGISNGEANPKSLNRIATQLVKLGLYVATESDGRVEKYIPTDMKERDLMLKLAMEKGAQDGRSYNNQDSGFLLFYSNNPNKISSEVPSIF